MIEENRYQQHGFKNREEYMRNLAELHGMEYWQVTEIAHILGPNEDFDGLVTSCEDFQLVNGNRI